MKWLYFLLGFFFTLVSAQEDGSCPTNDVFKYYKQGKLVGRNDEKAKEWLTILDTKLSHPQLFATIKNLNASTYKLLSGFRKNMMKKVMKKLKLHQATKKSKLEQTHAGLNIMQSLEPKLVRGLNAMLSNPFIREKVIDEFNNQKSLLVKMVPQDKIATLQDGLTRWETTSADHDRHDVVLNRRAGDISPRRDFITIALFEAITDSLGIVGVILFFAIFFPLGLAMDLIQLGIGLLIVAVAIPVIIISKLLFFIFCCPCYSIQ